MKSIPSNLGFLGNSGGGIMLHQLSITHTKSLYSSTFPPPTCPQTQKPSAVHGSAAVHITDGPVTRYPNKQPLKVNGLKNALNRVVGHYTNELFPPKIKDQILIQLSDHGNIILCLVRPPIMYVCVHSIHCTLHLDKS